MALGDAVIERILVTMHEGHDVIAVTSLGVVEGLVGREEREELVSELGRERP